MRYVTGGNPYALGTLAKGVFQVRCIRFGKLAASYERRAAEQIRAVSLTVADAQTELTACRTSRIIQTP